MTSAPNAALDDFSQAFGDVLFDRWPQWRPLATAKPYSDGDDAFLEVIVAAPSGAAELLIYTADAEVTVAFGHTHRHFSGPIEPALRFIEAILGEAIIVLSAWREGRWSAAWDLGPGETLPREDAVLMGATKLRIRSWSGAHDLDDLIAPSAP